MIYSEEVNHRSINNTITVVKMVSLIFCTIYFGNEFFYEEVLGRFLFFEYSKVNGILPLTLVVALLYLGWFSLTSKIQSLKYIKIVKITENCAFIIIYTAAILITGAYNSNLKFLFLFSIIISTIEINEYFGSLIAGISSINILAIDLIFAPKTGVNLYFQNDLVLAGVFSLIVWVLGHYVRLEKVKIQLKNLQLEAMNKELNENDQQRKYMEQLFLKVDSCYNMLVDNSNDAILVQHNGRIIIGNKSLMKLLQVDQSENVISRSIFDFVPEKDRDFVKNKLSNIFEGNCSFLTFEHEVESSEGHLSVVSNTSAFFVYEGKPTVLSILHNITPEKQVEKLQEDVKKSNVVLEETRELNKLITEFFSNVSHELKTPLNVIFSSIQLLNYYKEHSAEDIAVKEEAYMKIMKQNCYRLMRLINNLLDLTKLDSGFLKLNLGNYNIVSVVEDIVLSVAPYIESRGIDIVFDTDVEEYPMAIDPDKLERIILNLLSNSVKFTNKGGQIFVNIESDCGEVVITVRDTGSGIPESKLSSIFERFMQVDKTLRREREGSGIGLSLVKSFVDMHQGKISVNSELGNGSEFIIQLPAKLVEEAVEDKTSIYEQNIERISIEFSDIYSETIW